MRAACERGGGELRRQPGRVTAGDAHLRLRAVSRRILPGAGEVVYPWARGLSGDSILAYYEANGHRDWVHAASGAPTLKAQHPEFETYNQEFMRARAWRAPIATCRTRARAR